MAEPLEVISKKLDAILLVLLSKEIQNRTTAEKVVLLAKLGLSNQDIANILATTKGTVEVLKSRSAKQKRG